MKPVIALVGRPNVGKSTLFNYLTRSRDALVADLPGLTRDRIYGEGKIGDRPYIVVDTGGLTEATENIESLMAEQARQAMEEANAVVFLVDGRQGLTAADSTIAKSLHKLSKPVYVIVNKLEGMDTAMATADFQSLGLGQPYPVSASRGDGVATMMDAVLAACPPMEVLEDTADESIRITIAGRPNVGKSTLVNRILGEERVLVFDEAGTTRDSIYIPFERNGKRYTLIDTAGVRRRARVQGTIEKFSIVKTIQAIDAAHVVILVLDAREGISGQDISLAGLILESGTALIVAINKWDGMEHEAKARIKEEIHRRMTFLEFAPVHFISALHGSGVGDLLGVVERVHESATRKFTTPELNRVLEEAVRRNPPSMSKGRRVKLRYAHQGGSNPPVIVIHGTQTEALQESYRRYLANTFRERLKLIGTPIRMEFKTGENPFEGKKNVLTKHQIQKRRRLMRHVKK